MAHLKAGTSLSNPCANRFTHQMPKRAPMGAEYIGFTVLQSDKKFRSL